jgi:hypothetical protein
MRTDNTHKKRPTGGGNPTAGDTDVVSLSAAEGNDNRRFQTLRAAYALRGHALHRTDPTDGPVTYWAERWGLVRYLPTLHDVGMFLVQIGGRV